MKVLPISRDFLRVCIAHTHTQTQRVCVYSESEVMSVDAMTTDDGGLLN